jgi:hypothetical protein
VIRVEGVDVPRAAIAELALRLHRAGEIGLANHLGRAIDRDLDDIDLSQRDFEKICAVTAARSISGLGPLLQVMQPGASHESAEDDGDSTGAHRSRF